MAPMTHLLFVLGGVAASSVADAHAVQEAKNGIVPFKMSTCTDSGCTPEDVYITLDANWRWFRTSGDSPKTCFTNKEFTPDADDTCEVEEVDTIYSKANVKTSGSELELGYAKDSGSRVYILDKTGEAYHLFKMVGKEISFDAEMGELPCGSNGAVYFVEMPATPGGQGASAGIGYCDAQCPQDLHQMPNGTINNGYSRLCCNEMDLWEANAQAQALTAHPCSVDGKDMEGPYVPCSGKDCDKGNFCDSDGCDINPYRNGEKDFYGNGSSFKIDSSKKFTLTTQFIGEGTELKEIRRFFIQGGKKIEWDTQKVGESSGTSITDEYCVAENTAYKGQGGWEKHGSMAMMGRSLARGGVLALSIWNDPLTKMKWLDGTWEKDGTERGPCGKKDDATGSEFKVKYSDIRFGDIDTTTKGTASGSSPSPRHESLGSSEGDYDYEYGYTYEESGLGSTEDDYGYEYGYTYEESGLGSTEDDYGYESSYELGSASSLATISPVRLAASSMEEVSEVWEVSSLGEPFRVEAAA